MSAASPINRRSFLASAAMTLAAARSAAGQNPAPPGSAEGQTRTEKGYPLAVPGYFGSRPGIQLGTQLPATASEEDMQFARQLGVEWVMTSLRPEETNFSYASG